MADEQDRLMALRRRPDCNIPISTNDCLPELTHAGDWHSPGGATVTEQVRKASGEVVSLLGFKEQNHPQQMLPSGPVDDTNDRATQPRYFETFAERFGEFSIDVAAAAHNTKCERFYDRAADGLRQSWAGEHVWCNPPYSAIEPWVRKAHAEAPGTRGIVMLLPANRTEQKWWQQQVEPHRDRSGSGFRVEFLPGRMRFIKAGQLDVGPNERPPFGCCLLIWQGLATIACQI